MKRIIPSLLLAFVAVACDRDGPTVPVDGAQFGKGKPDQVQYRFVFPENATAAQILGGDCWWPHWEEGYDPEDHPENPNGRTFRCPVVDESGNPLDPTLVFQVVDGDGDPAGGAVNFLRCEDGDGVPQLWTKCGVRQTGRPKYHANQYGDAVTVVGGTVGVNLSASDRVVWHPYPIQGEVFGWGGMRWNYDAGDGRKPELKSHWYNIMPPYGHVEGG